MKAGSVSSARRGGCKRCPRCGLVYTVVEFKAGRSYCRECERGYQKEWKRRRYGYYKRLSERVSRRCQIDGCLSKGRIVKGLCINHYTQRCMREDGGRYYRIIWQRLRARKLRLVREIGGCCVDCGYLEHPEILEFDHVDPRSKSFNIAGKMSYRWSTLVVEAKKCELRCPNCHKLKTLRSGDLVGPWRHRGAKRVS